MHKNVFPMQQFIVYFRNQTFILVQALFNAFLNTKLTRNISLWVLRLGLKVFQNGLKATVDFLRKSTFSGNLN